MVRSENADAIANGCSRYGLFLGTIVRWGAEVGPLHPDVPHWIFGTCGIWGPLLGVAVTGTDGVSQNWETMLLWKLRYQVSIKEN